MESTSYAPTIGRNEKLCFDCKTSKTPLWRSGPAGPKSLCNACGIRFRKKKSTVGSDKRKLSSSSTTDDHTSCSRKREIGEEFSMKKGDLMKKLRINVVGMGKEHRSPMKVKRVDQEEYRNRNKMKFGEVEEAAYLLMCLSCG